MAELDPVTSRATLWKQGILFWKLWDQQLPIYESIRALPDSVTEVVVLCSRQYGKSYLGTLMGIEDCKRYPGSSVLIIGPTLKQTVDIVNQAIKNICHDAPPGLVRRSKSEQRWYIGSSELLIGGFDEGNATRQRGKSLKTIYVEEIRDSKADNYAETIRSDLGPALTHSVGGKIVFLTTPPTQPDHPFITDTMPRAKLKNAFYKYTIDDNRAISPEQYLACVERCGGKDSIDFRVEYLCEIVRDDRVSIAPHFDRTRHVVPHVMPDLDIANFQTTIDWGGVKDKTVALFSYYDFKRNKVIVLQERSFDANTDTETIVKAILDMEYPIKEVARYADAPGQILVDLRTKLKFECELPRKDDWLAGVNNMQLHFTKDWIEIDPSCKLLIETLDSGQFNKQKNDFDRSASLGHCDAAAALMYKLRMVNKHNPFVPTKSPTKFYMPKPDPMKELSKGVQPKTFGPFRNTLDKDRFTR